MYIEKAAPDYSGAAEFKACLVARYVAVIRRSRSCLDPQITVPKTSSAVLVRIDKERLRDGMLPVIWNCRDV